MFCQYKDIFGKPGQGVHKYRVCNIAIVDVLATIVFASIIDYVFQFMNYNISFWNILISLFLLGIILHRLFCVRTTIDKLIFG